MGWESLVERLEALWVSSGGVDLILLLASRPWMVEGSLQQPPLVRMGVELSPTPKALGISFLRLALAHRAPWGHQQKGSLDSHPLLSWEGPQPGRLPHR